MFTIDQNSHTLWDVVPKVHALCRRGESVRHFVEDIDVAFTAMGTGPGPGDSALRLVRERFHRSGGSDWGAALFYTQFLGRQAVEIRDWEEFTGMKTAALARQLERSVDDLYDEFSPGDNWQLIGPSYVGGRDHHRTIGDLGAAETAPFLREVMDKAEADTRASFPASDSQARAAEWFACERQMLERLIQDHAGRLLVDLYDAWLGRRLDSSVRLELASGLFQAGPAMAGRELLEVFLREYPLAGELYNQSIAEATPSLRRLDVEGGELPFFAILDFQGHRCRTAVYLDAQQIRVGEQTFPLAADRRLPLAALAAAGVRALAGKAILMVIQARLEPGGEPLALPFRGSVYMPAAHLLAGKLAEHRLLPARLHPIIRVRLRFLDRLRSLETVIRLPGHLAEAFGRQEVSARQLGEGYADLAAEADRRLDAFRSPEGRQGWQKAAFAEQVRSLAELDAARRELARQDPKSPQIRQLSRQSRQLQNQVLEGTLRQIARDWQVRQIDFFDSRGAILPWSIALGGQDFYNDIVTRAEVYEEP